MSSIQHNSIEADAIVSALREQVAALTKEKDELVDYSDRIADSKHEELAASQELCRVLEIEVTGAARPYRAASGGPQGYA